MGNINEYASIYGYDSEDVSSGEVDWSDIEHREYIEYIHNGDMSIDWSKSSAPSERPSWYKPWYKEWLDYKPE